MKISKSVIVVAHVFTALAVAETPKPAAAATPAASAPPAAPANSQYAQAVKRKTKGPITDILSKMPEEEFNSIQISWLKKVFTKLTPGMEEEYAKILGHAFREHRYYDLRTIKNMENEQRKEDIYYATVLFSGLASHLCYKLQDANEEPLTPAERAIIGSAKNRREFTSAANKFAGDNEKVRTELREFMLRTKKDF